MFSVITSSCIIIRCPFSAFHLNKRKSQNTRFRVFQGTFRNQNTQLQKGKKKPEALAHSNNYFPFLLKQHNEAITVLWASKGFCSQSNWLGGLEGAGAVAQGKETTPTRYDSLTTKTSPWYLLLFMGWGQVFHQRGFFRLEEFFCNGSDDIGVGMKIGRTSKVTAKLGVSLYLKRHRDSENSLWSQEDTLHGKPFNLLERGEYVRG